MFLFASLASCALLVNTHDEKQFLSWMRENHVVYLGSEYKFRLGIYLTNMRYIQEFNKGKHSFFLKATKFVTYTKTEYESILGNIEGKAPREETLVKAVPKNDETPAAWDWRDKGFVNAVKDQGNCGSCWAFGTCSAMETTWALKAGTLLSLSEQNLVDCIWDCLGCNGGNSGWALTWIKLFQSGKFMLESDYPYVAAVTSCAYDGNKGVTKLSTHYQTTYGDEEELKNSVYTNGAHSISMDCINPAFSAYGGGIYADDACFQSWQNHCMSLVGYGSEGETNYWIIRNSWGDGWGEKGYMRFIRNGQNTCGIASKAIYTVVSV